MITLGRAFGIPVRVDRSWFVVFAVVARSLALVYFPRALPAAPVVAHWAWGVGAAALLFASLLAHEMATRGRRATTASASRRSRCTCSVAYQRWWKSRSRPAPNCSSLPPARR